jgi:hypothetical protein
MRHELIIPVIQASNSRHPRVFSMTHRIHIIGFIMRTTILLVILGALTGCTAITDTASATGDMVSAGASLIP